MAKIENRMILTLNLDVSFTFGRIFFFEIPIRVLVSVNICFISANILFDHDSIRNLGFGKFEIK